MMHKISRSPGSDIRKSEGRKGEATEFVEFRRGISSVRFVAQKGSAGHWFVFEVYPGSKTAVRTLAAYLPHEKDKAVAYALNEVTHRG